MITASHWPTECQLSILFISASLNSSSEATIPCVSSGLSLNLVWRFNHTEVILRRNSSSLVVSESWMQQVELVSPSGNLVLKDLEQRHSGFYTCSLSTNVTQTHLTVHASGGEVVRGAMCNMGEITA